ncbi:MAG: hypothetical protein ACFCVH_14390 [Alphaproteobacteria bacterium]
MSTTPVESWQNVDGEAIGAIYPFVGAEVWLVIALVVLWVGWHIVQIRQENREIAEDHDLLKKNNNLERVVKGDNLLL